MKILALFVLVSPAFGVSALYGQQTDLVWDRSGQNVTDGSFSSITGGTHLGAVNVTQSDVHQSPDAAGSVALIANAYLAQGGAGGAGAGNGGNGADGQDGTVDVYALADGLSSLAPDQQQLLQWSFIHTNDLDISEFKSGGGGGGGGGAGCPVMAACGGPYCAQPGANGADAAVGLLVSQSSATDCDAVLALAPGGMPGATTDGTIEVSFEWMGSGSSFYFWDRDVVIGAVCGTANMQIWESGGDGGPLEAIYNSDVPPTGTNPVVVWSLGQPDGAAGSLYVPRGNCVSLGIGAGAQASIQALVTSNVGTTLQYVLFGGAGGGEGCKYSTDGVDGAPSNGPSGGAGGAGGPGGSDGGRGGVGGDGQETDFGQPATGLFNGSILILADW